MEQTKRTIYQIDPKTEAIIAEYKRPVEAARAVGCSDKAIHHVLAGRRKTAKGYIWERANVG